MGTASELSSEGPASNTFLTDIPEDAELDGVSQGSDQTNRPPNKEELKLPPIPKPRPESTGSGKSSGREGWLSARDKVDEIITTGERERAERRRRKEEKKQRLDTGHAKKSHKQQMEAHLDSLVVLMNAEWPQIAKMATSLKSGTGVVEEALVRKLNGLVKKINLLCLRSNDAAEKLIEKTRKLSHKEVQMLMKMFDTLNYPLLTDYVRVCLSNSSRLKPLKHENEAAKRTAAQMERLRAQDKASESPLHSASSSRKLTLGPSPEDLIMFVKPNVKSNFVSRNIDDLWGPSPEHRKGWIGIGLSKKPRDGIAKDAPPEVRHQLLSGWSTGEVYNSELFIDPVKGHSHTPVYPLYNSDDEDAAKEQMQRIRDLPAKLERSKIEDEERRKIPPAPVRGRHQSAIDQEKKHMVYDEESDDDYSM